MWGRIIPIEEMVDITPNDSVDLARPIRSIYVGVSGDVKVNDLVGGTHVIVGLAAGVWHPCCATRVFATDTTATDILGGL